MQFQINPQFRMVMDRVTRWLIEDPRFYDSLALIQCDIKLWPPCPAKQIALEYEKLRAEFGHDYAQIQLWEKAAELQDREFSEDPKLFRAAYFDAYKKHQVDLLRHNLLVDPMHAEKYIAEFKVGQSLPELTHIGLDLDRTIDRKKAMIASGKSRVIIPGFEILSDEIAGFNPSRVGMLVAQTGFGKTTCAINLGYAASQVMPVLYLNMEMSEQDFHERLICCVLRKTQRELEWIVEHDEGQINELRSKTVALPFHFSRGRTMSAREIFSVAMEHKSRVGLGMLIIDYDQKISLQTSKDTPEWKALQQTIEALDELSKTLECFILVLAQESADGDVSGSRRSKFPASSVIRFFEDKTALVQPRYVLRLLKNRYGKQNQEIEVDYDGARYSVVERKIKPVQVQHKSMGEKFNSRAKAAPYPTRRDTHGD